MLEYFLSGKYLSDDYFWYTISFLLFLGVLLKYAVPVITQQLDARIAQIIKNLEEAENLRIEAQEMLAQYQRKHRDALKESQKIIDIAKENARQYKENALLELEAVMKVREEQLIVRLERMEQSAIVEIQTFAADLAMKAAKQIIEESLDKKTNTKLVDDAIKSIEQNIH
jgi:F-type H+-transporting ATPase subunit b